MANLYNLDGIKTEINKHLDEARAALAAWQAVTFPTKKDGSPFKLMSKNIEGASYRNSEYSLQPGEYQLHVTYHTRLSGYGSDDIKAYDLVRYLDDAKRAKTQNYQPKAGQYLEQVYTYDLDDIKEAVANRIEWCRKRVAAYEKQLTKADEAYAAFAAAYRTAAQQLEEATDKAECSELYYDIIQTVTARYPYC